MEKSLFEKIFNEFKKQLKNTSEKNKKLIICFAGIPGSGKTWLAKKLEKRYKGVRINSDDIRKIIDVKISEDKREDIVREFLLDLLKSFSFDNKLVILDTGIERKYDEIYGVVKVGGWEMFITRMIAPKKRIIKRIKKKDKERLEKHPEDIKRWFEEYKEFNKKVKPDFIFKNDSNLKKLFSKLDISVKD